jgi:nucleotide-binding universal stress UspA family protein
MFKHILIPTDGSETAQKAVQAGVTLAKEMGAKVTGFWADDWRPPHLHNGGHALEKDLLAELDRRAKEFAERCVDTIKVEARKAGVPFESVIVKSARPAEAIINAANDRNCDAIVMASHGHKGLTGLILGSVTQQVLSHSVIPVLVYR